jgi:hypothetical protein
VRIPRLLRAIALGVLAAPAIAAQACGTASSNLEQPSNDASDPVPVNAPDASADAPFDAETSVPADACAPVELDAMAFDDSGCGHYLRLPCGFPDPSTLHGCVADLSVCISLCQNAFRCQVLPYASCDPSEDGGLIADAEVVFECIQCAGGAGRRPRGYYGRKGVRAHSVLGQYFAELTSLEAASVTAFEQLSRTLVKLRAPRSLRHAATRAAADERRHAAMTRRLARRFGAAPHRPLIANEHAPSIEEALIENAVEGCIGESYGALVCFWQSASAKDLAVATAMRRISVDEAAHAELSWNLLRWGAARLDGEARARVRARLDAALGELRLRAEKDVPEELVTRAGCPSTGVARELVRRFESFARVEAERALGRS